MDSASIVILSALGSASSMVGRAVERVPLMSGMRGRLAEGDGRLIRTYAWRSAWRSP